MTKKLTGLHPLAYMGVNSEKPPNLTLHDRNPLVTDYQGFNLGSLWLYPVVNRIFILSDKTAGVATWLQIATAGGGDDVEGLITDDALTTTPNAVGKITISGSLNIDTEQVSPHELKIELDNDVNIAGDFTSGGYIEGGTGLKINSLNAGVVTSNAAGAFGSSNGTNGQIIIGGGASPIWANIIPGAGITINENPNSIEIIATSGDNDLIVGSIIKYDGAIPGGASWLPCDGSSVDQATYATLFARIGHEYLIPTYTLQITTFTGTINCVAHNGLAGVDGLWVAAGSNGELETSPDGITWTPRVSQFGADSIYGVAHTGLAGGDGLWTAVGVNGKISTSVDGITWVARVSNFPGGFNIFDVSHNGISGGGYLWVCCGSGANYSTSADGIIWANNTTGTGIEDLWSVTYNSGAWVIGDRTGSISDLLYSTSGTAWSVVYAQNYFRTANTPGFTGVTSSGSLFIATSDGTQTNPQSLTSLDGINWKNCGDILGRRYYPNAIGYGDGWFTMGACQYGRLARSKDGEVWETITSPFDNGAYPITGDTIYGIASNGYANPDTAWVATSNNAKLALGVPSINTATHFYLPNIPGYVILF